MTILVYLAFFLLSILYVDLRATAAHNSKNLLMLRGDAICSRGDKYITNSTFHRNLNSVLTSFLPRVGKQDADSASAGLDPPDKAYGYWQCRGDLTFDICRNCVEEAIQEIVERCPNSKEAVKWYDECMLRYSNHSFLSIMQSNPTMYQRDTYNVSNPNRFNPVLADLMNYLVAEAVASVSTNSSLFALGDRNFTSSQSVYGLVQCTTDISTRDCKTCLEGAIDVLATHGKQGGRIFKPSCYVRYEIFPFYTLMMTAIAPVPSSSLEPEFRTPSPILLTSPVLNKGKKRARVIIAITVLIGALLILTVCMFFFWRWSAKQRAAGKKQKDVETLLFSLDDFSKESSNSNMIRDTPDLTIFNFEKLAMATNNFNKSNKLGKGGFGTVYKGTLSDGQEIAVKRLSKTSGQGLEEFKNEVVVISKLQHRNLVRLLGCCIEGEEKMLIYEYMPNKSLDSFLYDPAKRAILDWRRRFQIIEGIARGILYLHRDSRLRVIHRDLKASNILLDEELIPKISDFGMARIFKGNEFQGDTSRVAGTYGYMPPEYVMHGRFSEKSDVFSFGVLLLEIVSGHKNSSFRYNEQSLSLLGYAWRLWNEDKMQSFADSLLSEVSEPCFSEEILRCIHVGLLCVQEIAKNRPTVSSIISMITSETATLPTPSRPAYTEQQQLSSGSDLSENFHIDCSVNDVTISSVAGR